jgi:DNA-binding response OmpR family regulator
MPHSGKHILVVDDNQEILDMITLMLGRHDFKVSAKNRAGDFIHEVREMRPDLILMDKNLGWADGCDLCAMIKTDKDLQGIPVIMFSAYHKTKEHCLFSGADAFLQKPFDMKHLLETIQTLTDPGTLHMS